MNGFNKRSLIALMTSLCLANTAHSETDPAEWSAMKSLPPGVEVAVISGNPEETGPFVVRLKLPANYIMPAHNHVKTAQAKVISGTYYVGTGTVADATKGKAVRAGQAIKIPSNIKHYGWTKEETVLQISGNGPWEMLYTDDD
jgi:quercetin dioxygenase-like cupin family protein